MEDQKSSDFGRASMQIRNSLVEYTTEDAALALGTVLRGFCHFGVVAVPKFPWTYFHLEFVDESNPFVRLALRSTGFAEEERVLGR